MQLLTLLALTLALFFHLMRQQRLARLQAEGDIHTTSKHRSNGGADVMCPLHDVGIRAVEPDRARPGHTALGLRLPPQAVPANRRQCR